MIAFDHMTVRYRSAERAVAAAIADVSLTVPQGTVCAIIGPSGCGKSTLLRAVAGLVQPEGGCVKIAGGKADPKKYRIGFMPQNYGLLPWQTVRENIVLGCRIRHDWHAGREEDEARLARLMAALHIEGLATRYPHELSGGQQQRVSLARSFLLQPDILLMDARYALRRGGALPRAEDRADGGRSRPHRARLRQSARRSSGTARQPGIL